MGRVMAGRAGRIALDDDAGFSLVEVLVAAAILVIALAGTLQAMLGSMTTVRVARERQQAVAVANEVLERARTVASTSVAMRSGSAELPGSTVDPDGTGPIPAETVLHSTTGAITGSEFHFTAAPLTVRTWVTWYDDPTLTTSTQDLRRVTVTVTWPHDGRTETVRASTLVSAVPRGSL